MVDERALLLSFLDYLDSEEFLTESCASWGGVVNEFFAARQSRTTTDEFPADCTCHDGITCDPCEARYMGRPPQSTSPCPNCGWPEPMYALVV